MILRVEDEFPFGFWPMFKGFGCQFQLNFGLGRPGRSDRQQYVVSESSMNYETFQDGNDFHSNQKVAHSLKPTLLKSLKEGGRHAFPSKFRPMFNRYLGGVGRVNFTQKRHPEPPNIASSDDVQSERFTSNR